MSLVTFIHSKGADVCTFGTFFAKSIPLPDPVPPAQACNRVSVQQLREYQLETFIILPLTDASAFA